MKFTNCKKLLAVMCVAPMVFNGVVAHAEENVEIDNHAGELKVVINWHGHEKDYAEVVLSKEGERYAIRPLNKGNLMKVTKNEKVVRWEKTLDNLPSIIDGDWSLAAVGIEGYKAEVNKDEDGTYQIDYYFEGVEDDHISVPSDTTKIEETNKNDEEIETPGWDNIFISENYELKELKDLKELHEETEVTESEEENIEKSDQKEEAVEEEVIAESITDAKDALEQAYGEEIDFENFDAKAEVTNVTIEIKEQTALLGNIETYYNLISGVSIHAPRNNETSAGVAKAALEKAYPGVALTKEFLASEYKTVSAAREKNIQKKDALEAYIKLVETHDEESSTSKIPLTADSTNVLSLLALLGVSVAGIYTSKKYLYN